MRINRYLARCGLGSRRKVEELILSGHIFVNGEVMKDLSRNIDPTTDTIKHNCKKVYLPQLEYIMLNKPTGYTVTKSDKHAKKNVFELLPKIPGLVSVGRLDRDTSGLLLFTNDGDFAQNIIHPSRKIEKEYILTTSGEISDIGKKKLLSGIKIEDFSVKATEFKKLRNFKYRIIVMEGKKRQIRRMIAAVGARVVALKRVRIGNIKLDVDLGKYRNLKPVEIQIYAKD